METLDIVVVAVIALSALFAFFRGFTREVLSIGAWLGAAAVAYYTGPMLQPILHNLLPKDWQWVVDSAYIYYLPPFLVAVVFFSLIVGIISSQIRKTALGALDRTLGLLFGIARGVLLLCLVYLVGSHMTKPDDQPDWLVKARSRPLLAAGADQIQQLIPRSVIEHSLPGANRTVDQTKNAIQAGQAANDLSSALDKLTAQPQPKPVQKPTDPNNPEANSDSKGLDQLIQAQGDK
jgi:membrane protein required for colicin V production